MHWIVLLSDKNYSKILTWTFFTCYSLRPCQSRGILFRTSLPMRVLIYLKELQTSYSGCTHSVVCWFPNLSWRMTGKLTKTQNICFYPRVDDLWRSRKRRCKNLLFLQIHVLLMVLSRNYALQNHWDSQGQGSKSISGILTLGAQ